MKLVYPNRDKCIKCGICAEVCPMSVIKMSDEGYPEPKDFAYRLCINCGYCVDVCEFGALNHRVRKRSSESDAAVARYKILKEREGKQNEK